MFGPKREKITGGWRKLQRGKLRDLYILRSASIIRAINSRMMTRQGTLHVCEEEEWALLFGGEN